MFLCQLRVPLGHFDVRMTEDLRQLVEVAAVHHEPRGKAVAQVVEPEVRDAGQLQYGLETSFHSLPFPFGAALRRKMRSSPIEGPEVRLQFAFALKKFNKPDFLGRD